MFTYIVVIINIIVFILVKRGKLNVDALSMSYHSVFNRKEYYRIITSAFLHQDIYHIACNMLSLINVGTYMEDYLFGTFRTIIIYFGSMIFGKILSLLIRHNRHDDYTMSLGASGAISGLLGAYFLVILYFYGIDAISSMYRSIASFVVMSIMPGIDGTSHISCLAIGMIIAYLMIIL